MRPISPEDFEIILKLIDWDNLTSILRIQAVAADDPTLTRLYAKHEEQNKSIRRPDSA